MGYQSIRAKIAKHLENRVLPYLKKQDLDYYKVIDGLSSDVGCSKNMIKDVLNSFIDSNKIKEIRVLTIPDEQIKDWLNGLKQDTKQDEQNKEFLNSLDPNGD